VPDELFTDPRLVRVYDHFDGQRDDLDLYLGLVEEFAGQSVVDIGCGTGVLCRLLAGRGLTVTGTDPALASIEHAQRQPGAEAVRWLHGDATALPDMQVDVATMTGNVAQVFVDDGEWQSTLDAVHCALRPGGVFAFETRNPARQAWEQWNKDKTFVDDVVPGIGRVSTWVDVLDVATTTVTFRTTYTFHDEQLTLTSHSTLRFRNRDDLAASLAHAAFDVVDIRDAPDRPGREWVYVARRP
jgi:SAM-dependent methyltransferase